MENAQPTSWGSLIQYLQEKNATDALSRLYSYTAEEKGQSFEGLHKALADIFADRALFPSGYDTNNLERVFHTAPFSVSESATRENFSEDENKKLEEHRSGVHNGGSLINRDKYQDDIIDNLHETQQNNAIDELHTERERIRQQIKDKKLEELQKTANLTDSENEELQRIKNQTASDDAKNKQLEELYRKSAVNEAATKKFNEILERNETMEKSINEQGKLLADQLNDPSATIPVNKGEESPSGKVLQRKDELLETVRDQERAFNEMQNDGEALLTKREQKRPLTRDESIRLDRYESLKRLHHNGIQDRGGWAKRFSNIKQEGDQDVLLRKLLARQQRRTRGHVYDIFSEGKSGRFGNHKKILSRAQRRGLLNSLKKKNRSFGRQFQRGGGNWLDFGFNLLPSQFRKWEYEGVDEGDGDGGGGGGGGFSPQNAYNSFKNARSLLNAARGLFSGGGAAGATTGAAGATAGVVGGGAAGIGGGGILLIALLIAAFIVLIVILVISVSNAANTSSSGLGLLLRQPCADLADIAGDPSPYVIKKAIATRFDIELNQSAATADQLTLSPIDQQMFEDTCVLFGQITGLATYPPASVINFNTFGNLVVGTVGQRQNFSELLFRWNIIIKYPQDTNKCSVSYDGQQGNIVSWTFHSPETCQPAQLDFLIAQNLGYDSILQQEHFHGNTKGTVYYAFNNTPDAAGIIGQDGLLPTNDCSNDILYGVNVNDQQNRACFADMVGAYFTYPIFFDGGGAQQAATESGIINSPLSNFPNGTFKDYYAFAKKNLFDNVDMWIPGGASAADLQRLDEFFTAAQFCNSRPDWQTCFKLQIINAPDPAFAAALTNVDSNHVACGQFIYAVQQLLSWPLFPGVGFVELWFAPDPNLNDANLPPNPTQQGYNFFYNDGTNVPQAGDILIYGNAGDKQINNAGSEASLGNVPPYNPPIAGAVNEDGHVEIVTAYLGNGEITVDGANWNNGNIYTHSWNINTPLRYDNPGGEIKINGWWRKSAVKQ